jgi:hypothetical protein
MYLSKAGAAQQCPMRYYWSNYCWLQAKERPVHFRFGSAIHKAVEIALNYSFPVAEAILSDRIDLALSLGLPESVKYADILESPKVDKELMLMMLEAFEFRWKAAGIISLMSTEYSVQVPLADLGVTSKYFTHWVVKADFIYKDMEGVWVGDLKSTSGYGPATAKYYHLSPQTKTYFHLLKRYMPALIGTKIWVVTKQKVRCEIEKILINEDDHFQAQTFIEEAVRYNERIQDDFLEGKFPTRCMTSCVNSYGQECPYIPICIHKLKSNEYALDLINNWYKIESPDKHLELGD